jgi:prenyltransferase beta subunit
MNGKIHNLRKLLTHDSTSWLLEGEPWVRYRTLVDLLDKTENDKEVSQAKEEIQKHPLIKKIFKKQNKDGYWGVPKDIFTWWPQKDTTFWLLPILADFGFTKEDKRIARACQYVFGLQLDSGGFKSFNPGKAADCHTAILAEPLAKMGFLDDTRLEKAYKWLILRQRQDGGWWCKDTAQIGRPREEESSCAFATTFVLGAMAQNPLLKKSKVIKKGVKFLLQCWENRGKIKYAGHDSQIGTGWEKLKYPFTDYRILKSLDTLSQVKFVKRDPRLKEMIDLLLSKQNSNGQFTPESIHHIWCNFDFGQKEKPSRWITFLALRILKRI